MPSLYDVVIASAMRTPIGAFQSILVPLRAAQLDAAATTLVHARRRRGGRRGIAGLCSGGGEAVSMAVELL
jgi:acetyl-CoA acetyltransferase